MFSKRTVLGAVCSLVLVGEILAMFQNGLLSLAGIFVFFLLYATYFMLADAYIDRYKPSFISQILFNFALYSVLITGFLHAELLNFLKPDEVVVTLLIRVQSALFILFVFPLVNSVTKRSNRSPSLKRSIIYFLGFMLIMSVSETFGIKPLLKTLQAAPVLSFFFIAAAGIALYLSVRSIRKQPDMQSRKKSVVLFVLGLVPNLMFFFIYAPIMIIISIHTLRLRRTL